MYTWHVTFGDQPAVQDLAAQARDLLRDVPGLDLVPGPWLHLTTQGVGFSDEVSAADLAAITAAARSRLTAVPPAAVTIGPARVLGEGIGCDLCGELGWDWALTQRSSIRSPRSRP
jgi:hypothetical protein